MTCRIEIDRQALKVLAALPKKTQRQIAERIDSLAEEPFPPDAQQIKGQQDIWHIRSRVHQAFPPGSCTAAVYLVKSCLAYRYTRFSIRRP